MGKWIGNYSMFRDPYSKSKDYMVEHEISYITNSNYKLTILPGFKTDGASVPRLFRWYISPFNGPWAPAACLHDLMYRINYMQSRSYCDYLFKEALITSNIRLSMVYTIWLAVRLGGWIPWRINVDKEYGKQYFKSEFLGNK